MTEQITPWRERPMSTLPPDLTDPDGRLWIWDRGLDCYRFDNKDEGTWLDTAKSLQSKGASPVTNVGVDEMNSKTSG